MEAELVEGKIADKADYKVEFKDGKLCAELSANLPLLDAGIVIKVKAEAVLDALKAAIPGHFDDAVLDAAKLLLVK